jgi:hypothetical protein
MLRFTFNHKSRPRWAFALHKLTSPGLPHLEWTKRGKFGWLWVVLDHPSVWKSPGEVDVFNIIFCTQKHRLRSKYSPFTPQDAAAAYSNYSKAGRSRRIAKHRAKASNGSQAAPKSWFHVVVGFGLRRSKPWWHRWSEGIGQWLRVWGRGRSNQKVCILAAGQDTAPKRDGRDEHHGRDVFDKKIMVIGDAWRWWVCVSERVCGIFVRHSFSYTILRKKVLEFLPFV